MGVNLSEDLIFKIGMIIAVTVLLVLIGYGAYKHVTRIREGVVSRQCSEKLSETLEACNEQEIQTTR